MIRVARTYVQAWSSKKDDESHPFIFSSMSAIPSFVCVVFFENTFLGISTTFLRYLSCCVTSKVMNLKANHNRGKINEQHNNVI